MNLNTDILERCPLFDGIEPDQYRAMLACLGAKLLERSKNEAILLESDPATHLGVLLSGSAQVVKEDYYGRRSVVSSVSPGQIFAETFACSEAECLPVSVFATENCSVLMIDCRRITKVCSNACAFHSRMILNLLKVVAARSLNLNQKLQITSQRTTREKLMCYLLEQAKLHGSDSFTIPFDRQAFADYLNVDRSALSTEIGKLRNEGVLESTRSHFRLLKNS